MAKERNVRIYGVQREDIDIDLMTQIVMLMGRQLAQERMTDEAPDQIEDADAEEDDGEIEAAP
jgi:hypothetical protein